MFRVSKSKVMVRPGTASAMACRVRIWSLYNSSDGVSYKDLVS